MKQALITQLVLTKQRQDGKRFLLYLIILFFDVKFAIDEYREIVKNYLVELDTSDGSSDEAFIGNLQTT